MYLEYIMLQNCWKMFRRRVYKWEPCNTVSSCDRREGIEWEVYGIGGQFIFVLVVGEKWVICLVQGLGEVSSVCYGKSMFLLPEDNVVWIFCSVEMSYCCNSSEGKDVSCLHHGTAVQRSCKSCLTTLEDISNLHGFQGLLIKGTKMSGTI